MAKELYYHFTTYAYWLDVPIDAYIKADNFTEAHKRLYNDDPAWRVQHIKYNGMVPFSNFADSIRKNKISEKIIKSGFIILEQERQDAA